MDDSVSCVMLCSWPRRAAMVADACAAYDLQTHANKELVVVNDGEPMRALRDDVRVYNVPRLTIGEKRNIGAEMAEGGWLATWDDDDVSFPGRLADSLAIARRHDAVAVRGEHMAYTDERMRVLGVVASVCYPTGLVQRDAWLRVGGCPPLSYAEDMELWARLMVRRFRTARHSGMFYAHRRHGANVTLSREALSTFVARALPAWNSTIPATQAVVDRVLAHAPHVNLVGPA